MIPSRVGRRRLLLVLILLGLSACGPDGESEPQSWTRLPAVLNAVSSLAFDSGGTPVIVGGDRTFGDYHVQRPRASDGLWEHAVGLPKASFGDYLFRAGDTMYAVIDRVLFYRLDDESSFTWSWIEMPDVPNLNRLAGLAADESVVYGVASVELEPGVFRDVLVAWSPGDTEWTVVPGSETEGSIFATAVSPQGRVVMSSQQGIFSGDASGVSLLVDCQAPEYSYCQQPVTHMVVDAEDVTYLVCGYTGGVRAMFRVPITGGTAVRVGDVPDDRAYCKRLQLLPDRSVILTSAFDNLTDVDAALFRLAPGGNGLSRILDEVDADFTYVVRDGSTVFRYGDGHFASGVERRGL